MKFVVSLVMLLGSVGAWGQSAQNLERIYCVQNRYFSPVQNQVSYLVLLQALPSDRQIRPYGIQARYGLQLFEKNLKTQQRRIVYQDTMASHTEDVVFQFRSRTAAAVIYLDELNQSSLSINLPNGRFDLNLICRLNSQGLALWN